MEKWMIVTGATGGVGKAFATNLAKKGYHLLLTDQNIDSLEELAIGLQKQYLIKVIPFACNLASQEDRDRFYRKIESTALSFSGLINVAGIDSEGKFSTKDSEKIRTIMNLNMVSVTDNIHHIIAYREQNQPFYIINVSSLAAFQPMPYKALYSASKRYLVQLSLGIREELKQDNIHVSVLCPAGMPTTRLVMDRIAFQGFFGQLTTMNTTDVVEYCLKQAMKDKAIIIPGFINQVIHFLSKLLPQTVVATMVEKKWKKVLLKRCGTLSPNE